MADIWDDILTGGEKAFEYITNTGSDGAISDIGSMFKDSDGNISYDKVAGGIGALTSTLSSLGVIPEDSALGKYLGTGKQDKTGYLGGIPKYTAARQQVPGTYDPERRPGSSGQRYFTDINYSGADTSGQAGGLQALNQANLAAQNRAGESLPVVRAQQAAEAAAQQQQAAEAAAQQTTPVTPVTPVQTAAQGGIIGLAAGGLPNMDRPMNNMAPRPMNTNPRYLRGPMDGMADTIPASIDGKDPAALSGGEFVVPADIVSGLGNGNSDAGAKNLYAMMDKIRQARTGMKKQPPSIDPNKMLPTARV